MREDIPLCKRIGIVLTIVIACQLVTYAAGANLLVNPGFEQSNEGMPLGWEKNYWDRSDGATEYSLESDGAHSGKACLKIVNRKPNDARMVQSVRLEKNRKYRFSAWIKTQNVGKDGRGGVISMIDQFSPITDGVHGTLASWTEIAYYIVNERENSTPQLSLGIGDYSAVSTGTVFFDDASLVEVADIPDGAARLVIGEDQAVPKKEGVSLLVNPGFEQGFGILPDSWEANVWNQAPGAGDIFWARGGAHSGERCIRINNNAENDSRLTQSFSFRKNTKYRLSAWIKAENLGKTGKGAVLSILSQSSPMVADYENAESWKEIVIYVIGSDRSDKEETVSVGLGDFSATNTGTVWFDDVTLLEVDEVPAQAPVIVISGDAPASLFGLPLWVVAVILGILALTLLVGIVLFVKTSDKKYAVPESYRGVQPEHADEHPIEQPIENVQEGEQKSPDSR